MVGVAGKSKGCTTCRRRKVKCDEGRPICERCKQANRECEGYERYPVFIHRTQNGYKKRVPLEETKSSKKATVLSLSSPEAEAVRIISWFWESFARAPSSKHLLHSRSHWLEHFMSRNQSLPPLRQALLAVSMSRWSRISNRLDVLKEGRQIYTRSLGMTRRALEDPKLAAHDDILAASCVMTLYELFDSTTNNLDGWLDHLSGIYRLLQHRGPKMHNTAASLSIFEHARYLIMLQHLVSRKACVLGEPQWLEQPWKGMEKSVEQQVFDFGLKLASVFERCDLAVRLLSAEPDFVELFNDCLEIHNGIQRLRERSINPVLPVDLDATPKLCIDPFIATNLATIMLEITALGIQLGAFVSACEAYSRVSQLCAAASIETPSSVVGQMERLFDDRQPLAPIIIRSVRACINERVGAMGAATMTFSLRLAIMQLDNDSLEKDECIALLKRLSSLGHRFQGLMKARDPEAYTTAPEDVDLIRENAAALAAQWQHLADIYNGTTPHSHWMPLYVEDLPCEALATWARS